jgi:hypothetical protein
MSVCLIASNLVQHLSDLQGAMSKSVPGVRLKAIQIWDPALFANGPEASPCIPLPVPAVKKRGRQSQSPHRWIRVSVNSTLANMPSETCHKTIAKRIMMHGKTPGRDMVTAGNTEEVATWKMKPITKIMEENTKQNRNSSAPPTVTVTATIIL